MLTTLKTDSNSFQVYKRLIKQFKKYLNRAQEEEQR